MVGAQTLLPVRDAAYGVTDRRPAFEFDGMALAAIETDRLDMRKPIQRPGQASGGILAAGEHHEG